MTIYAIRLYVFNLTMGHYGLVICVHFCFVKKSSSSSVCKIISSKEKVSGKYGQSFIQWYIYEITMYVL